MDKHGDQVDYIQVGLADRSTEDAYRVALRYAEQFGLDRKGLDLWYRKRLEGRRSGREELLDRARPVASKGGSVPTVQSRSSRSTTPPTTLGPRSSRSSSIGRTRLSGDRSTRRSLIRRAAGDHAILFN